MRLAHAGAAVNRSTDMSGSKREQEVARGIISRGSAM